MHVRYDGMDLEIDGNWDCRECEEGPCFLQRKEGSGHPFNCPFVEDLANARTDWRVDRQYIDEEQTCQADCICPSCGLGTDENETLRGLVGEAKTLLAKALPLLRGESTTTDLDELAELTADFIDRRLPSGK